MIKHEYSKGKKKKQLAQYRWNIIRFVIHINMYIAAIPSVDLCATHVPEVVSSNLHVWYLRHTFRAYDISDLAPEMSGVWRIGETAFPVHGERKYRSVVFPRKMYRAFWYIGV